MLRTISAIFLSLALSGLPAPAAEPDSPSWRRALPGWRYEFPRDHFTHDDFRTEWWYVTGNLRGESGRNYGCQFTIFRRGVRPPGARKPAASRFVVDHLALGHFAFTDVENKRFSCHQKLLRGAFGEAGFSRDAAEPRLAWMDDWEIRLADSADDPATAANGGSFTLAASLPDVTIQLRLKSTRPPVFHGADGVSQKAAGEGNASHYYSLTRLEASGEVTSGGKTERVTGWCWLDREWATNQLAADQAGWDWFSLRLSDGRDLMVYQLRRKDGSPDPFSSGTLARADGSSIHLQSGDFTLTPVEHWTSPKTGGRYPVRWRIEIPAERLTLEVRPVFPEQELALEPVSYWEGSVRAKGEAGGAPLTAEGYLEMTGYAGPLRALQR